MLQGPSDTTAIANNEDDFAIAHFDKGEDVLYNGLNQHNKFFGELLKDDKLMRQFLELYIHDAYKTLRDEASSLFRAYAPETALVGAWLAPDSSGANPGPRRTDPEREPHIHVRTGPLASSVRAVAESRILFL